MKQQSNQIENLVTRRISSGKLRRVVAVLSAFVLLTTMNSLKFSADTLERIPTCNLEEHEHVEACYNDAGELVCGKEAHVHTDACYQQRPSGEDKEAATRLDEFVPLNAQVSLAAPVVIDDTSYVENIVSAGEFEDDVDEVEADLHSAEPETADSVFAVDTSELVPVAQEAMDFESEIDETADETKDTEETETAPEETTDEESKKYTYEIDAGRQVLLSAVLNDLGVSVEVAEACVARSDEGVMRVEPTADGDYAVIPLEGFEKAEIAVVVDDGKCLEAFIITLNAAAQTEAGEADQTAEAPEIEADDETAGESETAEAVVEESEPAEDEDAQEPTEAEETKEAEASEEEIKEESKEEEVKEEETKGEETEEEPAEEPGQDAIEAEASEEETRDEVPEETEEEQTEEETPAGETPIVVDVDFGDIVKNGVDFDSNSVISAADEGVTVDIAQLEAGFAGDEVANGELSIDYTAAQDAETASQSTWDQYEVVSADPGLEVVDGAIQVTADGTVTLTDGTSTIDININGYEPSVQKVRGDGVEIEVLNGDVPMGASASYEDISERAETLAEEYNLNAEDESANVGFSAFDVAINTPSGALDAAGSFAVTVPHPVDIPEGATVELFHIHEVDGQMVAEKVENVTVENGNVIFVTDGFSEYVIRYTLDFEYTDPETGFTKAWKWPGQGSYSIAAIMAEIGVEGEISEVALNMVEGVMTEGGLRLEEKEDSWYLTSDAAFAETYELTVEMDGVVYTITVTDAQTSSNLNEFVGTVSFDNLNSDDTVKVGREYNFHISFAETNSLQFATDGNLVYTMPDGIDIVSTSGTFNVTYKGTPYSGNTFSYDESTRKLTIAFSDTVKALIAKSSDASFTVDLKGVFTGEKRMFEFGNAQTKNFVIEDSHDTTVEKSGAYYSSDNKVHYTITAKSDGVSQNVVIQDTVNGTALTYDKGSITMNGNSDANPTITETADGFTISFAGMNDQETIYIYYTASVDLSKITGKGTVTQTGNTVKITAKDDPGEEKSTDVSNSIDYNPLVKKAGQESGDGNIKTLPWTITVNDGQLKSVAGTTITDRISDNSKDIMYYFGNGITVTVMDGDYVVSNYSKTWQELGIDPTTAQTWSYTLPNTEDDQNNTYKYIINYTTEVDATGKIVDFSVTNEVRDDENHASGGSGNVTPGTDRVTFKKKCTSYSAATSNWELSFTVPKDGLSSAIVTDTFPHSWQPYQDTLVGNITITGLLEGESYTVDTSDETKVVITFYKTTEKTGENTGLLAGDAERTVKVLLSTTNDENWVINESGADHWNNAQLEVNGQVVTDSAKSNPKSEGVSKTGYYVGTKTIDGREYPIFKYVVSFFGITDDSFNNGVLTFTDDYDETYLTLYNNIEDDKNLYITDRYGNNWTSNVATYSDQSGKLTFTIEKSAFELNNGGGYLSGYQMVYYLTAKDADALDALETASINAVDNDRLVPINNTVTWGKYTDKVSIDYKYPAVTKNAHVNNDARTVDFTIELNPDGLKLNDGKAMEMTDSAENLSIDYSTIVITPSNGVTYYYRGNTGYFTIPDSTKVTITYTARIIGDGAVTFSNEASMKGYRDSTTQTTVVSGSAEGNLNIEWALIYKHEYRKMEQPINGVTFVMTDSAGNPVLYPATAKDGLAGKPVTFTTGRIDLYKTPDGVDHYNNATNVRDGYAWLFLSKDTTGLALQKGITYYLKEYSVPADYQKDDTVYSFTIANNPDYDSYEYYSGDVLRIANTPVDGVLEVRKSFMGAANLTDTQKTQIKFTISAVDTNGQPLEFPYGKDADGNTLSATSLTISYADFENGVYRLDRLPYGTYTVTETDHMLSGYNYTSTTYKVGDEGAIQTGYETSVNVKDKNVNSVAYTNTYTPIPSSLTIIKKDSTNTVNLYGATFQLLKKDASGQYVPYQAGYLTSDGKFTIDYENRETGVTLPNLENGDYRLVEIVAPTNYLLDNSPIDFTVSASNVSGSANGSHVLRFENNSVTISNTLDHTFTLNKVDSVKLSKKLYGARFEVYELTAVEKGTDGINYTFGSKIGDTYTTDVNGQIVIDANKGFDTTKVYAVKETVAPAGYALSDTVYTFYTGQTAPSMVYTLNTLGIYVAALYDGPQQVSVPNTPNTMDLFVKKMWHTTSGDEWHNLPPANWGISEIEVKLYQVVNYDDGTKETRQYPDEETTYKLTVQGDGVNNSWLDYKWTGLPTGNSVNTENPETYSYYVEEIVPEGFDAHYGLTSAVDTKLGNFNTDANAKKNASEAVVSADSEKKFVEIINSPKALSMSVRKVWNDDGKNRPGTINVSLRYITQKDPNTVGTPNSQDTNNYLINVDLSSGNNWSYEWPVLAPGEPDNPRTYFIIENHQDVLSQYGYVGVVSDPDEDNNVLITNTKYTSNALKVKKVWLDEEGVPITNASELQTINAKTVKVQLQKEEKVNGEWSGVVTDVTKADSILGKENGYTVTVTIIKGDNTSKTSYVVKKNTAFTVKFNYTWTGNTLLPVPSGWTLTKPKNLEGESWGYAMYTLSQVTGDVKVTFDLTSKDEDGKIVYDQWGYKKYVNTEPEVEKTDVDNKVLDEEETLIELNDGNDWTHSWEVLTAQDGKEYRYSVREVDVPDGYEAEYDNNNGVTTGIIYVKNIKTPYTRASANKVWLDSNGNVTSAPSGSSVVFTLYQDGKKTSKTITLDGTIDENGEFDPWKATFEGLERYKADGVTEYVYTVRELTGYTGYVAYDADGHENNTTSNGGTIYNKEVRTLTAVKVWLDESGQEMTVPVGTAVTLELVKNGVATDKNVTLDGRVDVNGEQRPWQATFSNLDNDGTYTVCETNCATGYTFKEIKPAVGITSGTGTVTVYNQKAALGSLKLTKAVTVNGSAPTEANKALTTGDYTFTVKSTGSDTVLHTVVITYNNGVISGATVDGANATLANGYVVIPDLTEGDYVITETDASNGLTFKEARRGDNDTSAVNANNKSVTVHVTAGDTAAADSNAQAVFTNNIEPISVYVQKRFSNGYLSANNWIKDYSPDNKVIPVNNIYFKLRRTDGEGAPYFVDNNGTKNDNYIFTIDLSKPDDYKMTALGEYVENGTTYVHTNEVLNWVYTIENLPNGTYEPVEVARNGSVIAKYATCYEDGPKLHLLKNELKSITATKNWDDADNSGIVHPTIKFELYKKVGSNASVLVTSETFMNTVTASTVTWDYLPRYDYETGDEITYYVKEVYVDANAEKLYDSSVGGSLTTHEVATDRIDETTREAIKEQVIDDPDGTAGYRVKDEDHANVTFTNKLKTLSFHVDKKWSLLSGDEMPAGVKTITLNLYRGDETTPIRTVYLNGVPEDRKARDGVESWTAVGNAENAFEVNPWKAWIRNLPAYDENSSPIVYHVKEDEVPEGFEVVYGGDQDTNAEDFTVQANITNNDPVYGLKNPGITNKEKPFKFKKVWTDGLSTDEQPWPKDATGKEIPIRLTLLGTLKKGEVTLGVLTSETNKQEHTFAISPTSLPTDFAISYAGKTYAVTFAYDNSTGEFTVSHLPMFGTKGGETGEWVYYLQEEQVSGYQLPVYSGTETSGAYNGDTITNKKVTVSLPSTGGPGTTIFYGAGISLLLLAFLGFVLTTRKKERDGI